MTKRTDASYVSHIWHFLVDDNLGIPFCAGIIKQDTGEEISTQELRTIIKRYFKKSTGIEPYTKCPLCGKALIPADGIHRGRHVRCPNNECDFFASRKNRFKSREDYLDKLETGIQILEYVKSLPNSIWYHLSSWAESNFTDYKSKNFLRDFSHMAISKRYTHRQAKYALDLLNKAATLGFDYLNLLTKKELHKFDIFQNYYNSYPNNELFHDFSYPLEGSIINGIEITETVIERSYYTNVTLTKTNTDSLLNFSTCSLKEWVFLIGIYKSFDKDYLMIHSNKLSSFVQLLEENNCDTTMGPIQLNREESKKLTVQLNNLTVSRNNYRIKNFEQIVSLITNSANLNITFSFLPLASVNGFFYPSDQHVVVANNQTDFEIVFALLHEITHAIIHSYSLEEFEGFPSNWLEYSLSPIEFLCNSVAMEVLTYLINNSYIICIDEKNGSIAAEDIHKIYDKEFVNIKTTKLLLCYENPYFQIFVNDCIDAISNAIINSIIQNFDSSNTTHIANCYPNHDILPLEENENKQLFMIIDKLLNLPHGSTNLI